MVLTWSNLKVSKNCDCSSLALNFLCELFPAPYTISIGVVGEGMIADIYSGIIKAFKPMNSKFDLSWDTCLPNPHVPDFKRYAEIGVCIVICWVTVVLEPYALRVRQVVMRRHYPDRAKERSAWLVNHILRHRKNFVKKARRDMRRKYKKDTVMDNIDEEPLWHRLRKYIICLRCFDICLGCVMFGYYFPGLSFTFSIFFQLPL